MADIRFLQVNVNSLKVRDGAGGKFTQELLEYSAIIEVDYDNRIEKNGYIWVQHRAGWSAIRPSDMTLPAYVLDITHLVPETGIKFEVTLSRLNTRTTPNGDFGEVMLLRGDMLIAQNHPGGQPTNGGHTWWEHSLGWSSEKYGNATYMRRLGNISNPRPDLTAPPEPRINLSSTSSGGGTTPIDPKKADPKDPNINKPARIGRPANELPRTIWLVTDQDGVTIRTGLGTAARKTGLRATHNTIFSSYEDTPITDDQNRFKWIKHVSGQYYVALGPANGSAEWLEKIDAPGDFASAIVSEENINELPSWRALFTGLPCDISDKNAWFQYFGNNDFAFVNGTRYNYDNYSQGLHGGLDFGHSKQSLDVFARINGKVTKIIDGQGSRNQVHVESGPYTIIYQHLEDNPSVGLNQTITPDTKIGRTKFGIARDALDHLHLEVRYRSKMIVNPLELFPDEFLHQIVNRFNPETPKTKGSGSSLYYFYKSATWDRWTTPFEQPVIWNGAPVIGPKAK